VLERTLYRPMYGKPHLDQVLFSIGLTFMAVAAVDLRHGQQQQIVQLPDWLRQRFEFGSGALQLGMGAYRLFIVATCVALALALQAVLAAPASAAGCAPRWMTRAWPRAWAFRSTACSC
jgi:branched-chain amino acid transport system permease protein